MLNKFLNLFHAILCAILGFGEWYLIIWLFTKQSDPLWWSDFSKIMFILFGIISTESIRSVNISVKIYEKKSNKDEQI